MTLAADNHQQERDRVVCPRAIRQELIWSTYKQAHAGASWVIRCLQLWWCWHRMTWEVRLRVQQCKICKASKHGCHMQTTGWRWLYTDRPWQELAVDLIGPMPFSAKENTWILVFTEHFTRWADTLAISDALAPTVAQPWTGIFPAMLGYQNRYIRTRFLVSIYGRPLPDMGVNQSWTSPYHPQGNRVIERNNQMLGNPLRSLLLGRSQEEKDRVLPQIMRANRSTLYFSTQKTPNSLMLGWETRLPNHLTYHVPALNSPVHKYVGKLVEIMEQAHDALREKQWQVRTEDSE